MAQPPTQKKCIRQRMTTKVVLETTKIYSDNTATICIVHKAYFNGSTKHIDMHFHHMEQEMVEKVITLEHVTSLQIVADLFASRAIIVIIFILREDLFVPC